MPEVPEQKRKGTKGAVSRVLTATPLCHLVGKAPPAHTGKVIWNREHHDHMGGCAHTASSRLLEQIPASHKLLAILPLVLHHMAFLPIATQSHLRTGCTFLSYM